MDMESRCARIWRTCFAILHQKTAVAAAEYAILAVGIVIVVGAAVLLLDFASPLRFAGQTLLREIENMVR